MFIWLKLFWYVWVVTRLIYWSLKFVLFLDTYDITYLFERLLKKLSLLSFHFLRIPVGTSPELCELLCGLLKRNARERMNFETFFNHKFLQRPEPPMSQSPLQAVEIPLNSPPSAPRLPRIRTVSPPKSVPLRSAPGTKMCYFWKKNVCSIVLG